MVTERDRATPPRATIGSTGSSASNRTSQPSRRSTSPMIAMSVIRGTFVITLRPGASSAAAISFSAEFLAPTTCTVPARRASPWTRMTSTSLTAVSPASPGPTTTGQLAELSGRAGIVRSGIRRLCVMAVHLTRIYTKAGDAGMTRLSNNEQVPKTDPRIAAYADVDECNAAIGVAIAMGELDEVLRGVLGSVQNDLFDVGADLSTPVEPEPKYPPLRVTEEYVERLEGWCDEYNARLSKLDSFILPGGTAGAALLHVARTIARRAERAAWALVAHDPDRTSTLPAKYLNRLSDLLFILSRTANPAGDVLWVPGGKR